VEKPILFNTVMVQAILEGKKTRTRRIVKLNGNTPNFYGRDKLYKLVNQLNEKTKLFAGFYKDSDVFSYEGKEQIDAIYFKAPYQVGDVLYVRETWQESECFDFAVKGKYAYLANEEEFRLSQEYQIKWRPSIHMPRVAARLFLKVTDVRVERLKNITEEEALKEGFISTAKSTPKGDDYTGLYAYEHFLETWDKIYSKQGNGWNENPWVWVIEFEKIQYEI